MEDFNKIYSECVGYADYQLKKNKIPNVEIDPEGLVAEAYIACIDNLSKESINLYIVNYCIHNKRNYLGKITSNIGRQITTKACTECHEVLPIALYKYVHDKPGNFSYYKNYCMECEYKKQKVWKRGCYKKSEKYRESQRRRVKAYWKREFAKLSDKYIKQLVLPKELRRKGLKAPYDITPQMIEDKRKHILEWRAKKLHSGGC